MIIRLIASSLCLFLSSATLAQEAPADHFGPGACAAMLAVAGQPEYEAAPDHRILCRTGYVLSHNQDRLTPDWVLEVLPPDRFVKTTARTDRFVADPDLTRGELTRATPQDYKGSGFDRGHMAAAANMAWSETAMVESFYLSNMVPQVGRDMNQGIWRELETLARELTCDRGTLVVISGPIYDQPQLRRTNNGAGQVAIPDALYKIIYDPDRRQALALLMPNIGIPIPKGTPPTTILDLYAVSIDVVEQRTGIDFLPALPDKMEARIERAVRQVWHPLVGCRGLPTQVADSGETLQ